MRALVVLLIALACATSASAGSFQVGIADPGDAIPPSAISELELSVERRTVVWQGEATFAGNLHWTPGLRSIVTVSGGYPVSEGLPPTSDAQRERYCGFVASILERYPRVSDVIVWNEPNLAGFWGVGIANYARLLSACAPTIRAHGARVLANLSPSTPESAAAFAREIAPSSIDEWSQHVYGGNSALLLKRTIAAIRATLGWRIPVLVGESGGTGQHEAAWQLQRAYCAGASGWLNFKLRQDGDWLPTGLEDAGGTPLPFYWQVAAESHAAHLGSIDCSDLTPPPPSAPLTPPSGPNYNVAVAERLAEVGGWARDAYAK
jgi:hypothetical protein